MIQPDKDHPTFEDLDVLAEASQLLTVVDLDRVIHEVIGLVSRAVGAQKTSLFLHEDQTVDWAHLITMRNLSPDQSVKVVGRVLEDGFAGWVHRYRRGDIIQDTNQDERWIVFPDDPIETRSAMCVPFIHNDKVIATVTLIHEEPNHFRTYHLRLMEIIANQATVAIRNAQLVNHLREERRKLRAVLQSITDILLVLDPYRRIVMLNDSALPLLGVKSQGDAIGQVLDNFVLVDDVFSPIVDMFTSGLGDTQRWTFETRSERRQSDYQVRISLWDAEDELLGYVVVMNNVTTLHDLSRFKDEMLRVASHDLRSPLALVAGYADMVAMDTPDKESPILSYVKTIKDQVDKMSNLVDDLLRVERIRSNPLELHEKTDVAALVKVVLVNLRPLAGAKKQRLEHDVQLEGVPRIVTDQVLIRQAMENLISNAIKYTQEGGVIKVFAYYDENRFHFVVEDNGMGIPEEHQPYVFESFYRVNRGKNVEKGSGLGLALVKNVIARHEGEVWLRSETNVGSRFGFWLPLYRQLKESERETVEAEVIKKKTGESNVTRDKE
jgi:two-component system phosphate regulon sensor histidine kinase PhoR